MSGGGRVMKEGFLIKSPPQDKLMAQWQRRFFVLWSTRLMEYYSSSEKRPQDYRKTIDLNNCEDMVAPLPVQNRQHVIKLSVRMGAKTRDYYFDCLSECDMEKWVKCLATVCGFSAVEEANCSAAVTQSIDTPKLRPPMPPPKPPSTSSSPPPVIEEVVYDDPKVFTRHSNKFEESIEEVYDNIDEANAISDLNKCPPPVWKKDGSLQPPPLPPSHPARRYTRSFNCSSEEFATTNEWTAAPNQPESPQKSNRKGSGDSPKKNKKHFGSFRDTHRIAAKQKVKTKPPTPPTKPRKFGSSDDILSADSSDPTSGRREAGGEGRGMGFNLINDPNFGRKLEERRQEIYDDMDKSRRPKSWANDQESYEEVAFSISDNDLLSSTDEEYVDCEPHEEVEPQQYLDFETAREEHNEAVKNGVNGFKRETFLKRPPLPSPNPTSPTPLVPKVPVGGRTLVGPTTASFAPRPVVTSTGSDSPPPVPRRANERPPLPLPPSGAEEGDEAPPVPRRHPNASDKHTVRAQPASECNNSPPHGSPSNNPLPLPPRLLSPSSPPSAFSDSAPPIPHRGSKPLGSVSPPSTTGGHSPTNSFTSHAPRTSHNRPPLPLPRNRSLSPEDLSTSPSDHVFEEFKVGPLSLPSSLPQESRKKTSRTKANPPVPSKNQLKENYETQLPPDIGIKRPIAKKKLPGYEVNLPPSIGNRPPQPKPPGSSTDVPSKPPVASKPPLANKPAVLPKSPPHTATKPQVSKKPPVYPVTHPKPPAITPKPAFPTTNHRANTAATTAAAVGQGNNSLVNQVKANFNNQAASNPGRTPNSREAHNSQVASRPAVRRNVTPATKAQPPLPPAKPKPLLPPPATERRKLQTTPHMY